MQSNSSAEIKHDIELNWILVASRGDNFDQSNAYLAEFFAGQHQLTLARTLKKVNSKSSEKVQGKSEEKTYKRRQINDVDDDDGVATRANDVVNAYGFLIRLFCTVVAHNAFRNAPPARAGRSSPDCPN